MIELKYQRCGDYLLPDLGLTDAEKLPLGKYISYIHHTDRSLSA